VPERHIHQQGQYQWPYNDWLAELCGPDVPRTPQWRLALWEDARKLRQDYSPDEYRDKWDNEQSIRDAHAAFAQLELEPASA
jgi:hypothetical protein